MFSSAARLPLGLYAVYRSRSLNLIFTGTCENVRSWRLHFGPHGTAVGTNGRVNKALGAFSRRLRSIWGESRR